LTSIVCWLNQDDYFGGVWAVSDSRVSGAGGILTDNCPKLFAIHANSYSPTGDFLRRRPMRVLSFGFGFAGSTLIGANVKEMLATVLGDLRELAYYDAPDYPFEERIPPLADIAELARKLAETYILSIGVHHPNNAKCELVIFGFCIKSSEFKVFKMSNSPEAHASVGIEDLPVSDRDLIILGDRKAAIRERILSLRTRFEVGSANWRRAPITTLAAILREAERGSIGGYLQLCTAFRDDVRHLTITASGEGRFPFVGFDMYRDIGQIGGFLPALSFGLSEPGPDGWPEPTRSPDGDVGR
jgi:hypothetical protein